LLTTFAIFVYQDFVTLVVNPVDFLIYYDVPVIPLNTFHIDATTPSIKANGKANNITLPSLNIEDLIYVSKTFIPLSNILPIENCYAVCKYYIRLSFNFF